MPGTPADEARAALSAAGQLPDEEIEIAAVAVQFARLDSPGADWRAAMAQLSELARGAATLAGETPEERRAGLAGLIHGRFGFSGDTESYDSLANANLIEVLRRRRGLPVALGVLWLHAAEAAGWGAWGVDFPAHFLLALEGARGPLMVDVFAGGTPLPAPALRELLKRMQGPKAELSPALLAPMTRRGVLLRLQNNIRLRLLQAGQLEPALAKAGDMLRLAPDYAPLWRETGLLNQRLGQLAAALDCLERSLELEPEGPTAERMRRLVVELRQRLN